MSEHYLSTLGDPLRWEICVAAKRLFQRDIILDIIFRNLWYEFVTLYDVRYPDGNEKKGAVAFRCFSNTLGSVLSFSAFVSWQRIDEDSIKD